MDLILQPWPWWISGILVGLTVPLLYFATGQGFGISTSYQQIGAMGSPHSRLSYFRNFDKRKGLWTLMFALGITLGGFISANLLTAEPIEFLPASYLSLGGAVRLFIGGILIGFGARYAGGCTSGHAINGIANLNLPSLLATIFFFVGGLSVTWGLGYLIF
ncbi:MAG: YeeE/YedE thiosulfate transporter family protein [Pirellulaceae bacterium]|nr:YeeE/YedE thiosulfate transporter family protein [Pirellulaceae bacterium]